MTFKAKKVNIVIRAQINNEKYLFLFDQSQKNRKNAKNCGMYKLTFHKMGINKKKCSDVATTWKP